MWRDSPSGLGVVVDRGGILCNGHYNCMPDVGNVCDVGNFDLASEFDP